MNIYDRKAQLVKTEQEVGGESLGFLYHTVLGRFILRQLIRPGFSNWKARQNNRPRSAKKIGPFIKEHGIDLSQAEKDSFTSFNDFFTRKLKPSARPIDSDKRSVIAVSDGKLFTYPITDASEFQIKNSRYTLIELLQDQEVASLFAGGTCLVYRLAMDDYHRYAYPDAGRKVTGKKIKGVLHTVRPLAHEYTKVFAENTRQWELLVTEQFGHVLQMEVGAMLVGKINNHGYSHFQKGQEKGFFEYGASSIVVCYQKDQIKMDADILASNEKGLEVTIQLGEKVGTR